MQKTYTSWHAPQPTWWPSRTSEVCCACGTSSIVTTSDCKKVFRGLC